MIEIEKYARAAASTARTPPNSPARRAALEAENAARVAAEQFVKGLEAERGALSAWKDEIEAQEPVAISKAGNLFWAGNPQDWRGVDCGLFTRPVPAQAVPDGCGACGDGCATRGSCRLAMRLNMEVNMDHGQVAATVGDWYGWARVEHDGTEPDKLRAWREAAVKCAAAVGAWRRREARDVGMA